MDERRSPFAEQTPSLAVIIPFFNEEDMIFALCQRLRQTFSPNRVSQEGLGSITLIFVDDGSRDNSAAAVKHFVDTCDFAHVCLIRLSRNFGHQQAVSAGLERATQDLVAIIDSDLQDPPEVIYSMVKLWRAGHEVVYGIRRRRRENFLKRLGYWGFYRILAFLSDFSIPIDSGDFCLMDKKVVRAMGDLPERVRFVRGLRAWVGFSQVGLEYNRDSRYAGISKYNLKKLYHLATDGIISTSTRPLRITQFLTFAWAVITLLFFILCVVEFFTRSRGGMPVWLLFTCGLTSFGSLMTLFTLYIFGGYLGRIYLEVKQRPSHVIMEIVEGDSSAVDKVA